MHAGSQPPPRGLPRITPSLRALGGNTHTPSPYGPAAIPPRALALVAALNLSTIPPRHLPLMHSQSLLLLQAPQRQQQAPPSDSRNTPPSQYSTPPLAQPVNYANARAQTADKITRDCYSKTIVTSTGARLLDSTYLTHVLVDEFSEFPSQPPPAGSATGPVKKRFLALCEKHGHRVQLHKGKLNSAKNVYQVGREWDLSELGAVTRVGVNGIILSFGRDYYWQVNDDPNRILKFARHLTVNYARIMGKYPTLYGFSLAAFELPRAPHQSRPPSSNTPLPDVPIRGTLQSQGHAAHHQSLTQSQEQFQHKPTANNPQLVPQPLNPYRNLSPVLRDQDASSPEAQRSRLQYQDRDANRPQILENNLSPQQSGPMASNQDTSPALSEKIRSMIPSDDSDLSNHASAQSNPSYASHSKHTLHPSETVSLKNYKSRNSGDSKSAQAEAAKALADYASLGPPGDSVNNRQRASADFGIVEIEDDSDSDFFDHQPPSNSEFDLPERSPARSPSKPLTLLIDSDNDQFEESSTKFDNGEEYPPILPLQPSHPKPNTQAPSLPLPAAPAERQPSTQLTSDAQDYLSIESSTSANSAALEESGHRLDSATPADSRDLIKPTGSSPAADLLELDASQISALEAMIERDPEIDEICEEIHWDIGDDTPILIKKLGRELSTSKRKRVQQLVSLDFDEAEASQNVKLALREADNLLRVFSTMRIGLELIGPEIRGIEFDSGGLQLKKSNKQFLYDVLEEVLLRVDISPSDLEQIASFTAFENWTSVEHLEIMLINLHRALDTTRRALVDKDEDLSSMKAIQHYKATYQEVGLCLVKRFSTYMESTFQAAFKKLRQMPLATFEPKSLAIELNRVAVYSGLSRFARFFGGPEFMRLNDRLNSEILHFLLDVSKAKLHDLDCEFPHSDTATPSQPRRAHTILGRKSSHRLPFGSADASTNSRDSMRGRVESKEAQLVLQLFSDTESLITIVEQFISSLFLYDSEQSDFSEHVEAVPFADRRRILEHPERLVDNLMTPKKSIKTSELLNNMNVIFGSYIQMLLKRIHPDTYSLLPIMIMLESESARVHATLGKRVFVSENFLALESERMRQMWERHVSTLCSSLRRALVTTKPGILPLVKNVCQLFVHTELVAQGMTDSEFPQTRAMIDETYVKVLDELVNLFTRDDPLLKTSAFDEKQKEHRNICILQNIYFMLEQVSLFAQHAPVRRRLDPVFDKVRSAYFAAQFRKQFGKLLDFFESYDAVRGANPSIRSKKYNKKFLKSFLVAYNTKEIAARANEVYRKLEKHFLLGTDAYERELLDTLWRKLELEFVGIFSRLTEIVRANCDNDIVYNISKQDIHHIFNTIHP